MFIFPLIYLVSFIVALREVLSGNKSAFLFFIIVGLSLYTTAMTVTFLLGFKQLIPIFQSFKELLVLIVLTINVLTLKKWPKLHLVDWLIIALLGYTLLYAILPIGEQPFTARLLAFKSMSFYLLVYFTGRLFNISSVYINKYFNYVMLMTIAAGAIVLYEVATYQHLQVSTGYADYFYYFLNIEPEGQYGLSTTFESEGGYKRFASFYTSPLEHAGATLIALAVIMALYTRDDNKIDYKPLGFAAFAATIASITFAFSRAPLISYLIMIYLYLYLTNRRTITRLINYSVIAVMGYLIYQLLFYQNKAEGILAVAINTLNFSNPSSVGHLVAWAEGIMALISHPLGLGLGASGRVGSSLNGEVTGGENQYLIIGVQAGVIALVLYLSIYITFIRQGLKWMKILKGKERKLCIAVFMIKIGFLIPSVTSEFETSVYISYFNWFLSGLFVSTIMQYAAAEEPQLTQQPLYA
ncbi:hypothetical protein MUY27_08750 [Mucilaginibacter sp. RS28]|uniref:O-antigen ligase n=1 Tax=Mucilaginibacter straminoryzae TaxID=2932774 RepID=A0A9X1X3R0_9SPHI|nr:hypothetical protein [Mucilaginibacter straminoryzae]MCJ8209795.1 hypothetical protein [Mucilaginibacter straminoryzae]